MQLGLAAQKLNDVTRCAQFANASRQSKLICGHFKSAEASIGTPKK